MEGRQPKPFVWGFFDGETYEEFWDDDLYAREETCTNKLAHYLSDKSLLIYAHNGGKFDFFFLLEWLEEKISLINGRIAKCSLYGNELRDSFLILPLPLSAHCKDNVDYDLFEVGVRAKNVKVISKYLRSDCYYLYEWVTEFVNRFGAKLTIAGTAFSQLKKTGYPVPRTGEFYDSLFRDFYFGGRVQCFRIGEIAGPLQYYDINSAYPFAMLASHPCDASYRCVSKIIGGDKPAFYHISAVSKGALPVRGADKKLYFPSDDVKREYKVSGWEIRAGIETGTLKIDKVHIGYVFDRSLTFETYVKKFHEEKKNAKISGNKDSEIFAKLLLNSAYGKFGQDGRKFKEYCILPYGSVPENEPDKPTWRLHCDTETDTVYTVYERDSPDNSFFNVATAASITGYVRSYLWRAICASKEPIYCDTDSLLCRAFLGREGTNLGDWEKKADVKRAYIAQRKMYALETEETKDGEPVWLTASKGVDLWASDIVYGVKNKKNLLTRRDAPSFSLKYGTRFFARETNFSDIEKNIDFSGLDE